MKSEKYLKMILFQLVCIEPDVVSTIIFRILKLLIKKMKTWIKKERLCLDKILFSAFLHCYILEILYILLYRCILIY